MGQIGIFDGGKLARKQNHGSRLGNVAAGELESDSRHRIQRTVFLIKLFGYMFVFSCWFFLGGMGVICLRLSYIFMFIVVIVCCCFAFVF